MTHANGEEKGSGGIERLSTGIEELDGVLRGGLPKNRLCLVFGGPGSGKTTLGLQFLMQGARDGQRCLFISLLQSRSEIEYIASSHGWSLEGIEIIGIPQGLHLPFMEEQTLFDPDEVDLAQLAEEVEKAIGDGRPERLVFDSLSEIAVLSESGHQLRRLILRLETQLAGADCTSLLLANYRATHINLEVLETLVPGAIEMGVEEKAIGPPRRWLQVIKMRGSSVREGKHDLRILTGGLDIFPRLEIDPQRRPSASWDLFSSGNDGLDAMFGGGLESGTCCLITGTTGAGKSTLATLYADAAAREGKRSLFYCFDERRETFFRRSRSLGLPMEEHVAEGLVQVEEVNAGDLTPGELGVRVSRAVSRENAGIVVLDTVNGYLHTMPGHRELMLQLHEIVTCLAGSGALTFLVDAIHGIPLGRNSDFDASYIADTVVLARSFESDGILRRCIAVLKKRHGNHEKAIREFHINEDGLLVSEPLYGFEGILGGNPRYNGDRGKLLGKAGGDGPGSGGGG